MKRLITTTLLSAAFALGVNAQDATATIHADKGTQKINKEIYGQFAEHLGTCIYGGLWVGENSPIPNTKGYRNDVFQALKDLHVPVLRWPGGCFADDYHWMDGIGPRDKRPSLRNNNWGGTIEDNSFGTHEFLNLCEMLGCEPYISGDVVFHQFVHLEAGEERVVVFAVGEAGGRPVFAPVAHGIVV